VTVVVSKSGVSDVVKEVFSDLKVSREVSNSGDAGEKLAGVMLG
jgi:hypothetical protein